MKMMRLRGTLRYRGVDRSGSIRWKYRTGRPWQRDIGG